MNNIRYAVFDVGTQTYDVKCDCGHRKIYKKNGLNRSKKCPDCHTTNVSLDLPEKKETEKENEQKEEEYEFSHFEKIINTKTEKKLNLVYDGVLYGGKKTATIHFDLTKNSLKIGENDGLKEVEDTDELETFIWNLEGIDDYELLEELELNDYPFFNNDMEKWLFAYVKNQPIQTLIHDGLNFEDFLEYIQNETKDCKETEPHKILKMNKLLYELLKEESKDIGFDIDHFSYFQRITKKFNGNDIKEAIKIFEDFGEDMLYPQEHFFELLIEENYPSIQKYVRYLLIETKYRQGIENYEEALQILRDMIMMAKEMDCEYQLMPKSLKLEHDVIMMNYRVNRTKIDRKRFTNVVSKDEYKKLEYEDEMYKILSPKESDDLVREGRILNHCVGSYFNRVVNEGTKIFFLRKKDSVDAPLVTIEVRGRTLIQAKGKSNRDVSREEDKFIKKWAKEIKLNI